MHARSRLGTLHDRAMEDDSAGGMFARTMLKFPKEEVSPFSLSYCGL
jgi:hypothetical protein